MSVTSRSARPPRTSTGSDSTDGGSRALARLTAPPRKVGLALLVRQLADEALEDDIVAYLPELRQVRRIVGNALSGSMFGTDFSYADFKEMVGATRHRSFERLSDESLDGRAQFVFEAVPEDGASVYSRIVSKVDREWCVPHARRVSRRGRPRREGARRRDGFRPAGRKTVGCRTASRCSITKTTATRISSSIGSRSIPICGTRCSRRRRSARDGRRECGRATSRRTRDTRATSHAR